MARAPTASHHESDRDVDPERPSPGEVIGEEPAEQRANDGGDSEHRAERALIAASFAQRDDLADHGHRRDHHRAAADALQCSRSDQHRHRSGQSAEHGTGQEEQDRDLEDRLAAEQVAELTDDSGDDRRGQQITGHHPRLVAGSPEICDHCRQRGGHDRLVQGGQQHAEQHRNEDDVAALRADQPTGRCGIRERGVCRRARHTYLPLVTYPQHLSLDRL